MVYRGSGRHYVILLKEDVIEVVADELAVERHPGSTLEAAAFALRYRG